MKHTVTPTPPSFRSGPPRARLFFTLTAGLALLWLGGGLRAQCFEPKTVFAAGPRPFSVAVGDFDGDGQADLATANLSSDNVSVLLNDGTGGFAARTDFAAGDGPQSLAVGDFDGDGWPDLATANLNSATVSVLLNDGTGGFAARTDFAAGSGPYSVAVGDFDGDGDPDLAVVNQFNATVLVLLNDGAGGFAAKTDYGVGNLPQSVAVGDFDGDGRLDLAVANLSGYTVTVLLNDGAGGFAARTDYGVGINPLSVAVGDFDGDGQADLAVANPGSATVTVLLNDGAGGFAAKTDFAAGTAPYSVAVGDFDGDGQADLAVANYSSGQVSVLLNDGTGGFAAKTDFAAGDFPTSVVVGDFNGDGQADLAVSNANSASVSVLLNGSVAISHQPATDAAACAGGDVSASVTASGGGPLTYQWFRGGQSLGAAQQAPTLSLTGVQPGDAGAYTVVVAGTCDSDTSSAFVLSVSPLPTATVSGGGTVCQGQPLPDLSIVLTGTAPFALTYTDGTTPTTVTTSANPYVIANAAAGTYTLTALSDANCTGSSLTGNATVTVNALPTAIVSGGGTVCAGQVLPSVSIALTGTAPFALTYTDGTTPTTVTTSANPYVIANAAAGTYTLTAMSDANCTGTSLTGSATVSVNPPPTVDAGNDQSLTLGFGSNCTKLSATATGAATLSYAWDNGAGSGATVSVCPQQTTTYTVTLTDGNGCTASDQVTVSVQDVRCGNRNQNVTVCYYGVTQCVSEKVAQRYLKLGATLGGCGSSATRLGVPEPEKMALELSLKAFPNPVVDQVTVEVFSPAAGTATMEVLDVTGRARQSRQQQLVEGLNEVEFRLGTLPPGIYLIKVRRGYGVDPLGQKGTVRVSKQ